MANNVPNLDAMDHDSLWEFWKKFHRPTRKDAAWLVGDRRPGYTNFASALANYACNKAVAMKCRVEGNITSALIYEQHADLCYKDLPQDLKW